MTDEGTYFFYEFIHDKPIPRFGTLLRQVCEGVGITQPLLEKNAQAEYERMKAGGEISEGDISSSMSQQAISMVVRGAQRPSRLQTYIWIKVIKQHYTNEYVVRYFQKKDLEMPVFTAELEDAFWKLSGHQPPEAIHKAVLAFSNFDYVPRRLPRDIRTDPNLQRIHRQERDTDKLQYREIEELQ